MYNGLGSLSSWSLVSRVWSVTTRRHRFRTVTISGREYGSPSTALLCDPTSTILPFVHKIRFEEGIDLKKRYEYHDVRLSGHMTENHGTPFLDDILPKIRTPDLTTLQSLEIVRGQNCLTSRTALSLSSVGPLPLLLCSASADGV